MGRNGLEATVASGSVGPVTSDAAVLEDTVGSASPTASNP